MIPLLYRLSYTAAFGCDFMAVLIVPVNYGDGIVRGGLTGR